MTKKILILANYFGTVYKFRKELVEELISRGYEVVVSVPYREEVEKIRALGAKIIETEVDRKSVNPIKDLKLYFNYRKIIKEEKPDIVISYTIKPNVYGGLACRAYKVPFFANVTGLGSAYYNGGWVRKVVSMLYKLGLKKAKAVFFENEGNAATLINDETIRKEQAVVMHGAGVNLEQFEFCEMPEDKVTKFVFIGRIMQEKGIDELFYAISKIKDEYKDKVEFGFVGWFEDNYKETVKQLEKNDYIKFYGYQDDVIPFIKDSHCLILPSYHEGMANVLLEAASMGRALITSDIHGCKEAVVDGKNGFTCRVKDGDELYDKVKKFVELEFCDKKNMGKRSREHMEDVFDKNKVVKYTIEILNID